MDLVEFYSKVEEHPELRGNVSCIEVGEGEESVDCMAIDHLPSKTTVTVPVEAVEKASWEQIRDILTGKESPIKLYHWTRVVGYYSKVENWNESKVGELKDRHNGDYQI